jgi:hypothetical protein
MAGRGQLKWGSVEELQTKIDKYFQQCKEEKEAANIADLCIALDIHRDTFNYYAGGRYEERLAIKAREEKQELIEAVGEEELQALKEENGILCNSLLPYQGTDEIDTIKAHVSDVFKKAKVRMEGFWWRFGAKEKNFPMAMFALKAVHGYTDQPQETMVNNNQINLAIKIEQAPANAPVITFSED